MLLKADIRTEPVWRAKMKIWRGKSCWGGRRAFGSNKYYVDIQCEHSWVLSLAYDVFRNRLLCLLCSSSRDQISETFIVWASDVKTGECIEPVFQYQIHSNIHCFITDPLNALRKLLKQDVELAPPTSFPVDRVVWGRLNPSAGGVHKCLQKGNNTDTYGFSTVSTGLTLDI